MESLPVTLIVKAPNQQIEDQTIKCELTWTINKLKQHLSEVYPSKPAKHEQKLIYSGQLLGDSDVLKDVLRQYDGQNTHTLHLVCTSRFNKEQRSDTLRSSQSRVPSQRPSNTSRNSNTNSNDLNNTNTQPSIQQRVPFPGLNDRMANVPLVNTPIDPAQYAMHLAWMQQAYVQYMNQYMQMAAGNPYEAGNPTIPTVQPNTVTPEVRQPNPAEPQEGPVQPPAAAAQRDVPENQERDWLDIFYLLSRILVLFSVVYFYSNPIRMFLVMFMGLLMYIFQVGFRLNINNNNGNNTTAPPNPDALQQLEAAPSRLMVVWTFFTTFFASLIPDIPNAV